MTDSPAKHEIVTGTEPPAKPADKQANTLQYEPSSQGVIKGVPVVSAAVRRRTFCKGVGFNVAKKAYADAPSTERYTQRWEL